MARRNDWEQARIRRRSVEQGRENVDGTWMQEGLGTLGSGKHNPRRKAASEGHQEKEKQGIPKTKREGFGRAQDRS